MKNAVYLFGAGSSRELRFRINETDIGSHLSHSIECSGPLSNGFFYDSQNLYNILQSHLKILPTLILYELLSSYITKYCRERFAMTLNSDEILNDKEKSFKINIEDLFIAIEEEVEQSINAQPIRNHDINDIKTLCEINEIKRQIIDYIFDSLSILSNYCYSKNHRIFSEHVIKSNANIISFNWDILLDEALAETGSWDYQTGYGIKFVKVHQKSARNTMQPKESHNLLLKPHGSLNWYHSFNDSQISLLIPERRRLRGGSLNRLRESEKIGGEIYNSYIVPPGRKRKEFAEIWNQLKQVLSNADEIIAIGFSFNDKDQHVIDEFKDIDFKSNLKIKTVNPSGNDLKEKYRDVFKTKEVTVLCDSFSTYCNKIEHYEKD